MDVIPEGIERAISRIAGAIGEPARVRILYSLLDGKARTSTELAVIAEVSPSTTSVHLHRLQAEKLVNVFKQGKHRYYSLEGPDVGSALEALDVLAGGARAARFVPSTPHRLLAARTCYDHIAGKLGVLLHNHFRHVGWLSKTRREPGDSYDITPAGVRALRRLEIDVEAMRSLRRRFAYACLDWSERQPHLGGALGAALLNLAKKKHWVVQNLDSRALEVTRHGQRELRSRFGLEVQTA